MHAWEGYSLCVYCLIVMFDNHNNHGSRKSAKLLHISMLGTHSSHGL